MGLLVLVLLPRLVRLHKKGLMNGMDVNTEFTFESRAG